MTYQRTGATLQPQPALLRNVSTVFPELIILLVKLKAKWLGEISQFSNGGSNS